MKKTAFRGLRELAYLWMMCVCLFISCNYSKTEKTVSLKERLYSIVDTVPGTVGIAFISDVDTITIHNSIHYPVMSLFKLHQALAVTTEINARRSSIDSMVHISKDELDPEIWSPMLEYYRDHDFDLQYIANQRTLNNSRTIKREAIDRQSIFINFALGTVLNHINKGDNTPESYTSVSR